MTSQLEAANPYTDEQVEALALHGEDALREAVVRRRRRGPARRRWQFAGLTATVATAAALALAFIGGSTPERAWSAEAVRVAESVPRLLLPGWEVVRVDEFAVGSGEMSFEKDGRGLDLRWNRESYERLVRDRADSSGPLPAVAVAGQTARVFEYDTPPDVHDFTAIWRQDGYVLELRSAFPSEQHGWMSAQEYTAALAALEPVDVDAWLSAMPEDAVAPVDSEEVIDGMLADIPQPPGFDRSAIAIESVRDRYQVGALVTGAVACGWYDRWVTGGAAAKREAVAALAGSRQWAILREMHEQGGWSEVFWQYADALPRGYVAGEDGHSWPVEGYYEKRLGC